MVLSTAVLTLVERALVQKHGGHVDQLSKALPAMDRYRVYSMLKLLIEGELRGEQVDALVAELQLKAKILEAGARKRGQSRLAACCAQIENACSAQWESEHYKRSMHNVYVQLREDIRETGARYYATGT